MEDTNGLIEEPQEAIPLIPAEPAPITQLWRGTSVESSLMFAFLAKLALGEELHFGCLVRLAPLAFAGWDASGAKWFGYETFWVNRLNMPPEALDAHPDAIGKSLDELVSYVAER